jgi:hypothetical protein
MVLDVFRPYNITEFLRALAYFLSNMFCAPREFLRSFFLA